MFRRIWIFLTKNEGINSGRLFFCFLYVVSFLLPCAYAYFAVVPSDAQMYRSRGEAKFLYTGRTGYALQIGDAYFTCGGPFLYQAKDCFAFSKMPEITGKDVTVTWFHQPVLPLSTNRRVARIQIEGVDSLPPGYLVAALHNDREGAKSSLLFTTIWMLLGYLLIEFLYRMRKKK